jgi:hypothetical protein
MKNTKFLFLVGSLLLPFQAMATTTVCTKGKLERRVEVTPVDSAAKAPCEVKYFKESGDEGSVLWSAKNKADYCEAKASEFIQKLGTFGWDCSGSATAASTVSDKQPSAATSEVKAEEKKFDAKKTETPKTDSKTPAEKTAPAATTETKK